MVEIKAAQEILISLAAACVLCGDHAGDNFEDLAATQVGSVRDFLGAGLAFGRRRCDADEVLGFAGDDDLAHFGGLGSRDVLREPAVGG